MDIYGLCLIIESNVVFAIYTTRHILTYYFTVIFCIIEKIRVIVNLCSYNLMVSSFSKFSITAKLKEEKNLYLLFTLWISHIFMSIVFILYQLFAPHELISYSLLSFMLFQQFCSFSVAWSVSFLIWNISVHTFKNLVKMKKLLLKSLDENSGINQ
jgi:hypothetical protein